jgi:hypothetical protein
MKSDLAGGQLPSGLFGATVAWWIPTILAHNLNTAMKWLVRAWTGKNQTDESSGNGGNPPTCADSRGLFPSDSNH